MPDNVTVRNVTIEIEKIFISIKVHAGDINIFETLLRSLKAIASKDTPIILRQICDEHPSSSQKIISRVISKGSDIEKCIDETKYLVSILSK